MYDPAVLRFALISGLIGFSSFCVSYAFLVWRRRNAASAGRPFRVAVALRRWSAWLVLAGILTIGIAVAVREMERGEGVLSSDGLYAVRVPDDNYRVAYLAAGNSVQKGDLVARLESPEAEAKVQELELQCRRLEKQRDALRLESLELDHELVRHHQNAITAANQLRSSIGQLLPEHESVVRQAMMERLSRLEKIAKLDVDIGWYEGELARACSHQAYVSRELKRVTQLIDHHAVAQSEVDSRRKQECDANTETANLKQRIEGMKMEKTRIEQSLKEIAVLTNGQEKTLASELNRARTDYAKVGSEDLGLAQKLAADLQRAQDLRQQELEQLELKIQECRVQLAGVERTLIIRAPHEGTVVYRDSSPRSAEQRQPIFVLAKQPGFRLQARLPRDQVTALKDAQRCDVGVGGPGRGTVFWGHISACPADAVQAGLRRRGTRLSPPQGIDPGSVEGSQNRGQASVATSTDHTATVSDRCRARPHWGRGMGDRVRGIDTVQAPTSSTASGRKRRSDTRRRFRHGDRHNQKTMRCRHTYPTAGRTGVRWRLRASRVARGTLA